MKAFALLTLALLFTCNVYAAEWSNEGSTSKVRLYEGIVFLVNLSSMDESYGDRYCGTESLTNSQFSFPINEVYTDSLVTMLLAAEMGSRKIKVYFSGSCLLGRPEINGLQIMD